MISNFIEIKSYKLFNFPLLSIRYDGLNDVFYLFDKIIVLKKENDRNFWNDWE